MYEPVTATDQETILATTSVVVVALPHWQKSDNDPIAAIPDGEPLNTALARMHEGLKKLRQLWEARHA